MHINYLPSESNFENEMGEIEGNFKTTILLSGQFDRTCRIYSDVETRV